MTVLVPPDRPRAVRQSSRAARDPACRGVRHATPAGGPAGPPRPLRPRRVSICARVVRATAAEPAGRPDREEGLVDPTGPTAVGTPAAPPASADEVVEHAPDGLAVIDEDARFIEANPAAVRLC